jgi:16S rRNA (cytidine1402-2'-O)-methyltransferase
VARELTKRFEEVRRGSLEQLAADYARAGPPKGVVVLVIGAATDAAPRALSTLDAARGGALATMSPAAGAGRQATPGARRRPDGAAAARAAR